MARAHRHGGGVKSKLSQRFHGEHPDATPRTLSIKVFVDREIAASGLRPSVNQVARAFGMSVDKVEKHYRILGLV